MRDIQTKCKFCKNNLLIELGKIVECPNGCVPCKYCGSLLFDNEMEEQGTGDGAIDGMHVDCAGEYQQISREEARGDMEWAENEAFESAMCGEDNGS